MHTVWNAITEEKALEIIYKNVKMGTDSILNLLPYVKEEALRSAMTLQLNEYEGYAATVREALAECGILPKEVAGERLVAKIGASWRGMLGITQTELAKMLIESANACVTDMMRLQNHLQEKKGQSARLAASLIAFEEENVKRLRPYL